MATTTRPATLALGFEDRPKTSRVNAWPFPKWHGTTIAASTAPNSGRPRSIAVRTINGATIFIRPTYGRARSGESTSGHAYGSLRRGLTLAPGEAGFPPASGARPSYARSRLRLDTPLAQELPSTLDRPNGSHINGFPQPFAPSRPIMCDTGIPSVQRVKS